MRKDIEKAIETLEKGGILLYPSDTIWGIGCDATNPNAIAKIFKIKQRSSAKSLIILVASEQMLSEYTECDLHGIKKHLYSDEPTTIIYSKSKNLPSGLPAQDGSIAIRMVQKGTCLEMIRQFGKPVISTSANISEEKSPTFFNEISDEIKRQVDYTLHPESDTELSYKPSAIIRISDRGTIERIR